MRKVNTPSVQKASVNDATEASPPSAGLGAGIGAIGRKLALFCIRAYQATAPMRPAMCRYQPSCSEYAAQCIARHGVWTGVALGIRRILRCNPLSSGGYDPAP